MFIRQKIRVSKAVNAQALSIEMDAFCLKNIIITIAKTIGNVANRAYTYLFAFESVGTGYDFYHSTKAHSFKRQANSQVSGGGLSPCVPWESD
jgi:hypothetical protein